MQISVIALPLTAILLLGANAQQLGILVACTYAPYLGLPAVVGVLIDRQRRQPIAVRANWLRALLAAAVPALYALHRLTMVDLWIVALGLGTLSLLFDTAFWSLLPSLVPSPERTRANSRLLVGYSTANAAGPGLAAVLISAIGAPLSMTANALTYAFAGSNLSRISIPEPGSESSRPAVGALHEIRTGFRVVFGNRYLGPLAVYAGAYNFFYQMFATLILLFLVETLRLPVVVIGVVLACAGIGALVGAWFAPWIERGLGFGRAVTLACGLEGAALLIVPLVHGETPISVALVAASMFGWGIGNAAANVFTLTARQTLIVEAHRAKGMASYRLLGYGVLPFAALLAGNLASSIGLVSTLFWACIGMTSVVVILAFSPVARMRGPLADEPAG